MNTYLLSTHNINPQGKVHRNPHTDWLVEHSLERKETTRAKNGALIVYTGKYTGRSPKDKYIVDTPNIHEKINWNSAIRQSVRRILKSYTRKFLPIYQNRTIFIFLMVLQVQIKIINSMCA
jgi:phosphoenolpyruvate carboxykinase (ATP)